MDMIGTQSKIMWLRDLFLWLESDMDDGFKISELQFYQKHGILTMEEAVQLTCEYGLRKENNHED